MARDSPTCATGMGAVPRCLISRFGSITFSTHTQLSRTQSEDFNEEERNPQFEEEEEMGKWDH